MDDKKIAKVIAFKKKVRTFATGESYTTSSP